MSEFSWGSENSVLFWFSAKVEFRVEYIGPDFVSVYWKKIFFIV